MPPHRPHRVASSGRALTVGPTTATILSELSLQNHLNSYLDGLITVKDVLYYLLVAAISLFAAARVLESRRWR